MVGLAGLALSVSIFGAIRGAERLEMSVPEAAAPQAPSDAGATTAPSSAPAVVTAPPKARAGRVVSVADAMKELDLIRPARQKLADDFTLKMPDGKTFRLMDYRGRVVFVNFWATWCPPCREEMPAMERLYRQHKDQGFVLLAVSLDADPAKVPPFVRQGSFTFPIGLDPKMDVANTYGVRALPSSFIVDREGQLAALALGPRPWDNAAAHSLIEGMVKSP